MNVSVVSSGSKGNSCIITTNSGHIASPADNSIIIVDAGASISALADSLDVLATDVQSVHLFITHEHCDHTRNISTIIDRFDTHIYLTEGTHDALLSRSDMAVELNDATVNVIGNSRSYELSGFSFASHPTSHDGSDSVCYTFSCESGKVGVFTDSGCYSPSHIEFFSDCTAILLESNYDDDVLDKSGYPSYLRSRIRGAKGHLSNSQAMQFLLDYHKSGADAKLQDLLLGHISENANSYNLVEDYAKLYRELYDINALVLKQQTQYFNLCKVDVVDEENRLI